MVRLSKITTRTGDGGETAMADGRRVPKHHPRAAAIGAVDEANSAIGLARLHAGPDADAMLARIQHDLFDLGADLAWPGDDARALRILDRQVERLDAEIEAVNATLAPLDSFVLPGGNAAAAHLHMARALVRRAERAATALAAVEPVNPALVRYLNRLSDHLFVLARDANGHGATDVLWRPGATR